MIMHDVGSVSTATQILFRQQQASSRFTPLVLHSTSFVFTIETTRHALQLFTVTFHVVKHAQDYASPAIA